MLRSTAWVIFQPKKRVNVIDRYLATQPDIEAAQREYASHARAGTFSELVFRVC
jgi:hypothetical protein